MNGSRTGRIAMAAVFAAIAACSDDVFDPSTLTDFTAAMNGASEKPTAVTTPGTGSATFAYTGTTITFTITYSGLRGAVQNAHIHIGGPTQSGGVSLNLCTSSGSDAAPSCTASPITGAADATYLAAGVTMDQVVSAMRGFNAYVNLHTDTVPAGEIRGNIVGVY